MAEESAQAVVFEKIARGNGKIFILTRTPDYMRAYGLKATATTPDGDDVPASVVSCTIPGCCVVTLPILDVAQECVLMCQGVEVARKTFRPLICQLESALHTRQNDAQAQLIRNWDGQSRRTGCGVYLHRVIRSWASGVCIVQGAAQVNGLTAESLEGDFELRCINVQGKNAALEEPVCMKDVIGEHPEFPGLLRRTIEFSVRVPLEMDSIVLWVRLSNGTEGYASYEPFEYNAFRNKWDNETHDAFSDDRYDVWFKSEHAATEVELAYQAQQTFDIMPLFSVIVPLYNTPADLFCEMAESVLRQSYKRLEFILVNSTPENEELSSLVRGYVERDERVRCIDLPENRGITENTNAGIEAATGDFLCFLDHDDVITADALYWYVKGINDYPETDLLYSDEDKIADGRYLNPYFKPDWNPDLLTSMNYVCHFLCVRKSIVDELEPATREYDGSQDHNLTLRVSERARNIYHARRVLYHWRIAEGSTAGGIGAKPYALEAGVRSVQDHIDRLGLKGTVGYCPRAQDHYEVVYELEEHPLVSIIIPNKDGIDLLDQCITSILEKSTYDNYEIIVVENNSTKPETFAYYERLEKECDRVRMLYYPDKFNYSAINNFAVREARGDYLLFLNNDIMVITEDWMERMLGLCMRKGTGAVGVRLLFPDGTIQHAGVLSLSVGPQHIGRFSDAEFPGYACMYTVRQDLSAVTAACMMTSREAFNLVGGMDEDFEVAYNDIDFCYSLREKGLLVVYEPGVSLYHYESITRGYDSTGWGAIRFTTELGRMHMKWPQYFSHPDPYGNPHFHQGADGAYYRGFE